jgi:BlaI family transcriptional regulator, penicillinase repressor
MAKAAAVNEKLAKLSRRERECLDVLFQRGEATVSEVMERLVDAPGYSAVRATLNVLVDKGFAEHKQDGPRYVYLPTIPADSARTAAVKHLVTTFFGGSAEEAMVALLQMSDAKLSREAIVKLNRTIQAARKEGR